MVRVRVRDGDAHFLQLVVVVLVAGNDLLETLALTHLLDDLTGLSGGIKRRSTGKDVPVIEDGLGEGLTTGGGAEIGRETEGLVDGEVSLDGEERSTGTLLLREDVTTATGQDTVDTTHGLLGNLNLNQEDRLEKSGVGKEGSGVQDTAGGGDDLTATTVNGISVKGDIKDVEADGTHGLLGNGTLAGGPLETGDDGILDFVEVLDGLGLVNEDVGTSGVGTETPDLTGVSDIPAVLVSEVAGTGLDIVTGGDLAILDILGDLLGQGLSGNVETVVLVGRLGQGSHGRSTSDGLTVRDDGVGDTERNTGVILLEILQANLQVQLTGTGDDVLTGLGDVSQDTGVGLGETLETLDKLGKIIGVLDLDGTTDDGGDRELHDLHVVSSLGGGDGTRLEQELVNTDKTQDVTGGDILNGLDETTHHENGTLDSLDVQVILLTGDVVRTLDADLDTRLDGTGEDTTEGVEATLIGGGNHLGNVKHERSLRITVTDTDAALVVFGTLVESLSTVLLGSEGGGKVENHHLHESISGRQELAHDGLEKGLALVLSLLVGELDVELVADSEDLSVTGVGDGSEDLEDGVQDELVEGTLKGLALVLAVLGPLLGLGVEVVVAPETLHHLLAVDTELLSVSDSELTDSEGPAVETGTEGDGTLLGVDLAVTKVGIEVGSDDDVNGLDGTGEGLVKILLGDLQLEKSTVDLVDDTDGLDTLREGLTKDGLGLDTDTRNAVNDDEGTVSDTEGSSDLRGEVNVSGGVDQVDQELVTLDMLGDILEILLIGKMSVQGDGSGLDGNTSVLLVLTGIGETSLTSLSGRDNTGTLDQRIGQSGLSVIDWRGKMLVTV